MTTSNLEELIAKSTIEFPYPLSRDELKDLFGYIARKSNSNLGVSFSYSVEEKRFISGGVPSYAVPIRTIVSGGVPFDSVRSTSVEGTVHMVGEIYANPSFRCRETERTPDKFSAINFQTISGYGLAEHNPEEVKLWDYLRGQVDTYFSLKSQYD